MEPAKKAPRKKSKSPRGSLLFALAMAVLFALSFAAGTYFGESGGGVSNDKIAVVEVNGMISDASDIVRQLSEYRRDEDIKGIVLRVDSPGGAVAPSQEIYEEILRIRADNKKIYTSMGTLAASGGYYIACPTDQIFANPGTLTGSIGVIMAFTNASKLIEKIGLQPEIIKSGKFKDTGSPVHEMGKEERAYLQKVSDDVHLQFIEAVARGRHMKLEDTRLLADGRVFTGRQAKELKMVDQLGGLEETIKKLAEALGIEGRPEVVVERPKPGLLDFLMGNEVSKSLKTSLWPTRFPTFQYLWIPG